MTSFFQRLQRRFIRSEWGRRYYQKHRKPVDEIHEYWKNPDDGANQARDYLDTDESRSKRSRYLVGLIQERLPQDAAILEMGCNVGRNLNYLLEAGYRNLHSVEISAKALDLMKSEFPNVAETATIANSPIEDFIPTVPDNAYDAVFTVAVLEHVHSSSEWIFEHMARVAKKYVITLEDERHLSWRHFPREYDKVFTALGLNEVASCRLNLEEHGMSDHFVARVFEKPASSPE